MSNKTAINILLDQLAEAITANDLPLIKNLVAQGADIHRYINKRPNKIPTLVLAAEVGNLPIIQYLLAQGVDVNGGTRHRPTALHTAIWSKHPNKFEIIQHLIDYGADPNRERGMWSATPFMIALKIQDVKLITYLINHGADVNKRIHVDEEFSRTTPIGTAVQFNNAELLQLLIDHGADPSQDPKCFEGPTPLEEAYKQKEELAQKSTLIKKQIKANAAIIKLLRNEL